MVGRGTFVCAAVFITFAGCLGGPDAPDSADVPPVGSAASLLVHDSTGLLDAAAFGLPDLEVAYRLVGHLGGEPNLGVTSTGAIFTTASEATMRSRDHGQTWEVVHDFGVAYAPSGASVRPTYDPMLWVDPDTDRIFTNHLYPILVCSDMIISDDEGETWLDRPMSCGTPGVDHQKVLSAKPGPANRWPLPVYPNVVYYCYNKVVATNCAVSLDGGLNYEYETVVDDGVFGCGGTNGHPSAGPDGTVYILMPGCSRLRIAVSRDSGLTWEAYSTPFEISRSNIDDEVAVTTDGTVYVLYQGPDNLQYLGRSPDGGFTWQGPWRVSPPGVKSTYFEGLAAGDDGRLAFAYLGTRDGRGEDPQRIPETARWHLFYAYTETADVEEPVFVTQQVTPDEDPVQVGCIWVSGFPSGPCRNMYDFIDLSLDRDGRPYIAYTEGCVHGCAGKPDATGDDSRATEGAVAILDRGPSVFSRVGLLPSLGLGDRPLP